MIPGHFSHLTPKRNHSFQPLPLEQLHKVFWPSCHDPVGMLAATRRARATAHANDALDAQQTGKLQSFSSHFSGLLGNPHVGVKWIAAAV